MQGKEQPTRRINFVAWRDEKNQWFVSSLSRGRAVAARVAHNHKVAGSSPAPATKKSAPQYVGYFSW